MNRADGRGHERGLAVVRLCAIPVIVAGEQLVDHPGQHTALFYPLIAVATAYALAALVAAVRERPVSGRATAAVDFALLCALVYTSGGPFSQARFAFFVLPLVAALAAGPLATATATAAVVAAYLAISLLHPSTFDRADAFQFELAQGGYLLFVGAAATMLSRALAERTRRIDALAASRNRLVAQALDSEDRERRRLAEALHDEAVQNLLAARQEVADDGLRPDLALVRSGLDRTVEQLREAVFELHPYLLEHGGLGAAMQAVAEQQGRRGGFEAHVDIEAAAEGVRDQLLFSVGRELVTNAAKHAGARNVCVRASRRDGALQLEVSDDGRGFDEAAVGAQPLNGHIGLASCAERIQAIGGSFKITSSPGQGVRAVATVPVWQTAVPT